ncbi:MAG: preprotein translocase subunit SecG [Candidatus Eremiobacteraeota bacterium]|nr:preprotein translocase subunit SecG [Candidatus Eremiobacteraeota bacterium]
MLPALLAAATAAAPTATKAAAPAAGASPLPIDLPALPYTVTPHSPLAQHAGWLTHTFAALFIIAGLLLVLLLALQTTKQEGLSGTLGGRVESSTRRLGLDQQMARVTQFVAITFVIVATLISLSGI